MYLKEFENVEIILKHYSQPSRWEKTLGFKPELNKIYWIHWSLLKTKKDYRRRFIKIKCDDCNDIIERRIRDLDPNNYHHLCNKCMNKGERNGMYGKENSEKQKLAHHEWIEKNGNPFTWESSIKKIKEKNVWLKVAEKNRGKKRTQETKNLMSSSAIKAFKEGRRIPTKSWGKIKIRQYNGIDYQSKYELNFLKFLELINKFHLIERGPRISYYLNDIEHNYYVDYKIKNTDIVFEIKSTYYWEKYLKLNEIKKIESEKNYQYCDLGIEVRSFKLCTTGNIFYTL